MEEFERVTALLSIGYIIISVATAIEDMKIAAVLGRKYSRTVPFTAIAATILSVCVIVRWARG